MKTRTKIIGFLFLMLELALANTSAYARDNNDVCDEQCLKSLSEEISSQKAATKGLSSRLSNYEKKHDSLAIKCNTLSKQLMMTTKSLNEEKHARGLSEAKFAKIYRCGFIALAIVFIVLICTLIFMIIQFKGNQRLRHKWSINQEQSTSDMDMLKKHLVDFDDKFLQALLNGIENKIVSKSIQPNHSLALKIANEIARIETNLSKMDSNIRGYKQLQKSVERIKNYYLSQGYEIVDMLGKTYNEGMMVDADFVIDESLPEGSQVITSVKKPQVNYHGEMIQKATIIVTQNI